MMSLGPFVYMTNVQLNENKYSEMGFASKNIPGKKSNVLAKCISAELLMQCKMIISNI